MKLLKKIKLKIANSRIASNFLLAALYYEISIGDKYNVKNKFNKFIFKEIINFYKKISLLPKEDIKKNLNLDTKVILNCMKEYYFLGYYDFKNANILLEDNLKNIKLPQLKINPILKKIILINTEILIQELKINNWILEIEEKLIPLYEQIKLNNKEIEQCHMSYKLFEENSPEHLNLSRRHLEANISSIVLEEVKKDILELSFKEKELGNELLTEINYISSNAINSIQSSYHSQLLFTKLLLLKIKLEFYLGKDHQQLINKLGNLCNIHISKGSLDPIGKAMGLYNYPLIINKNNILDFRVCKNIEFNKYLRTFTLEINKKKNSATFKLKQLSNFESNSIQERLIINKL